MNKRAIIVDIDGTLADITHRLHFIHQEKKDWENFHANCLEDKINNWCKELIVSIEKSGYKILMLTGRDDNYRDLTKKWLQNNDIPYHDLFMRKTGDFRHDTVIKNEIYEREIGPKYKILFIVEDRASVVEMWRTKGLTVLQCDVGDF